MSLDRSAANGGHGDAHVPSLRFKQVFPPHKEPLKRRFREPKGRGIHPRHWPASTDLYRWETPGGADYWPAWTDRRSYGVPLKDLDIPMPGDDQAEEGGNA